MKGPGGYAARALGPLVLLVLANIVLLLLPSFGGIVLESWVEVLWAVELSLVLQIVGNTVLVFYHRPWLEDLLGALFAGTGLLALVVFFVVFPLDFSGTGAAWLNTLIRVLLIAGMAGVLADGIVRMVRFIGERWGAGESNP